MSEPTPEASGPAGRVADRRILVVGSAVAGLLLLGGSFLLLGGEEQVASEVAFAVPRRAAVAVPSSPAPSPAATATRRGDPVNPFLAAVTEGSGAAPTDGGTGAPAAPPVALPAEDAPALPGGPSVPTIDVLPVLPDLPGSPVDEDELPEQPVPTVPPATGPRATDPVAAPPAPVPTSPVPARHTLVLTRVTGTAPDLVGRFLVDGEVVSVSPGDDARAAFGPDRVLTLLGLEQGGSGWTAVVQIGTATPINLPAGKVTRFG